MPSKRIKPTHQGPSDGEINAYKANQEPYQSEGPFTGNGNWLWRRSSQADEKLPKSSRHDRIESDPHHRDGQGRNHGGRHHEAYFDLPRKFDVISSHPSHKNHLLPTHSTRPLLMKKWLRHPVCRHTDGLI
ncbi:MAG TPA: hypothetical protein VG733_04280 [Chthoniobacteraceae bacterium]|nr:hypothetical protein [Chthoniobacteraceae bacterium]